MESNKKIINGKVYIFKDNQWVRQRAHGVDEVDPHDPDYSWLWDVDNAR